MRRLEIPDMAKHTIIQSAERAASDLRVVMTTCDIDLLHLSITIDGREKPQISYGLTRKESAAWTSDSLTDREAKP